MIFKRLMTKIDALEAVREEQPKLLRLAVLLLARPLKLLLYLIEGLLTHGTMVRSAALTYYTLVSIVPVLALIFAVVKGFGLADGLVGNLYSIFPQIPEVVDYVVEFAEKTLARTRGGWVAAFSLAALFWSVVSVFDSIEDAFNNIWEVKSTRHWARKYSDYIALVVIAPLLWVVASSVGGYLSDFLGGEENTIFRLGSKLFSLVMAWVVFTLIYYVLPNTKVKLFAAVQSGIIAGTIFLIFQWLYLFLQTTMTSYNAIYGSFAALPLFLIWLQSSWSILLIGAEMSFTFQNEKRFDEEREVVHLNLATRRKALLAVMLCVARYWSEGRGAVSIDVVRHSVTLPVRVLHKIVAELLDAQLLYEVRGVSTADEVMYAPAKDMSQMRVGDLLRALDESVEGGSPTELHLDSAEFISATATLDALMESLSRSERNKKISELL